MKQKEQIFCTQLGILNERIRMYAGRVWQLPMTYFSVVAIAFIHIDKIKTELGTKILALFLILSGILISFILWGYRKRVNVLVANVIKIEKSLGIYGVSSVIGMKKRSFFLYLIIVIGGIFASSSLFFENIWFEQGT